MIFMDNVTTNLNKHTMEKKKSFKLKDPGSSITHFIGVAGIILAAPSLLIRAFKMPGNIHGNSMILFVLGVLLLYSASVIYHTFDISESVNLRLRKFDHMMIYMLIAGSYSPVCLIALNGKSGLILFLIIWAIAFIGIFQAMFWITCPKWITAIIYVVMGWLCVFSISQIFDSLSGAAFGFLLAGGIFYTVGAVIYAIKLPVFNSRHKNFGTHEIFHVFCLFGTLCHYILMYSYLAKMPVN